MKILFIDQFTEPGGAQRCLMDLLPEVERRGWHATLMAPGKGDLAQWCSAHDLPVRSLPLRPCTNGSKSTWDHFRYAVDVPRMAIAIRRHIAREGTDLIYVNGPRPLPGIAGIRHVPVIFHAHSVIGNPAQSRLAQKAVALSNAHVLAASQFVARAWPGASVIYNGVPDLALAGRPFRKNFLRIGILGRISPEKGHLDFVRAAKLIGGNTRFLVFGAPLFSDPQYDRAVREAAQKAPVEFCGWTDDIAGALREIDILTVPSGPAEAATRVIMEAFSAGTPVVAYASGGIPELVTHSETGILTESPDAEALARAVMRLMLSEETRKRLAAAGRIEWEKRFRIETFQSAVCDFIESRAARTTTAFHPGSPVAVSEYDESRV